MAKRAKSPPKLDPDDWLNAGEPEAVAAPDDDEGAATGTAGILVNKSRLGLIFGMSQKAIENAFANGAPYVSKGSRKEGWRINTAAFEAWRREELRNSIKPEDPNRLSFDEAKAKKTQEEYERIAMANRQKRRELVTIDEVVTVIREESAIVRSHLMALPGRVAIPMAAESDPAVIESMMVDEINIALSNISADNPEAWTDERGPDSHADE